jgi:Extensin-like protein C-terminus
VLGPGSDGYHEQHIHLDLAERHNNYRICEWDVRELIAQAPEAAPLPLETVPLPRPRPKVVAGKLLLRIGRASV